MNVAEWPDQNRQRDGEYDAVIADGRAWSRTVLHERACRLAQAFAARGVGAGDRVLLVLSNRVELAIAFEAALRSGAVAVPLFAGATATELARIVDLSRPAAVVTSPDLVERVETACASGDAAACLSMRIVTAGDAPPAGWLPFDAILAAHDPLPRALSRQASDPAILCYTSGTSGVPKGVVHTHGSIQARHGGASRALPARILAALPLGTLGASALTGYLAHRHTLILLETFEPRAFLAAIGHHRVTKLVLVPSMGEAIAAAPDLAAFDLGSLRSVVFTGADVPPELLARLSAVLPVNPSIAYGMTETGGGIAATGLGAKPGSVGRVLKGVDLRVVDDEGQDRPAGQVGEIIVRTPWMGAGYYQQPEDTASGFADGWIRTGDLGYVDDDRELFLVGRRKDLISQGGVKIAPREVQEVLRRLDAIADSAIVGLPHALLGEQVVACVVPRTHASIAAHDILAHCRAQLDPRKVPVRVCLLDDLPRTPTRKVDMAALRARLIAEQPAGDDTDLARRLRAAAPDDRAALLREAIEACLRPLLPARIAAPQAAIAPAATFGELGLDSVRLAQLAHAIGDALGRGVAPTIFFSHPTVEALCQRLLADIGVQAGASRNEAGRSTPAAPQAATSATREAIAIIGAGCRLPGGADTPDRFWTLLRDGVDATAEITRWDIDALYDPVPGAPGRMATRRAALLDAPESFDAEFFGLTGREALRLDPQHRLVLEVTWEAIEQAGYDPTSLAARRAGLYLGISGPSTGAMGTAPSMAVGRLCHFLDLRGPAIAIDTWCSSSLAAIHYAVQGLRLGECDVAITGGVQVIASPRTFIGPSEMSLLAPDGRCKAFDARADGFGRGEGCVVVVLKRLADAQRDGDRITAVIRGSALRHDGRSASLTAPNGRAQAEVMRAALEDAAVAPGAVDYLEAHGTGTPLGDPIEVEAAISVLADPARPLRIGSVKSNIGHLEAAAGAAGLLKTALALDRRAIPAHLHCERLNPLLEPHAARFAIPRTTEPWPDTPGRPHRAGVTSMGLSGTNVHVILEEPPHARGAAHAAGVDETLPAIAPSDRTTPAQDDASTDDPGQDGVPQLLCLSARTDAALRQLAARHAACLAHLPPARFADYCFTANTGRARFAQRLCLIAATPTAAAAQLEGVAGGLASAAVEAAPPLLAAIAARYRAGADPGWHALYGDGDAARGGRFRRLALPTYPFQREPLGAPARRRPSVSSPRPASVPVTIDAIVPLVQRLVADAASCEPDALAVDRNCLDLGLDSLGIVDIVAGVREKTGIACTPADFVDRPTIAGFAAFLADRAAGASAAAPVTAAAAIAGADDPSLAREHVCDAPGPCTPRAPIASSARRISRSPLVVLNDRGTRSPLFCLHPSGGRITPYLRLRALLGDDQPLYALQSRALDDPDLEYQTIDAMAADYARHIQQARADGPYRLAGWSMGGVVALAAAAALERRGALVEIVGLIDVIWPGVHATPAPIEELSFVIAALSADLQPAREPSSWLSADVESARSQAPDDLLAWCEARGWIEPGLLTPDAFDVACRLYRQHFALLRDHRPPTVDAPIVEWRASARRRAYDWSRHSRQGSRVHSVGGTHFSVMQPPRIERIATDLENHPAHHAAAAGASALNV